MQEVVKHVKADAKALVVLSGGQDSVTCLGYALAKFKEVEAISFLYNQRHQVEIQAAALVCEKHNVKHTIIDLGTVLSQLVNSALTDPSVDDKAVSQPHPEKANLPASFVPGRNALFLTLAHAKAQTIGANLVITGVCQTDYSGYPDCRAIFIDHLAMTLNVGYESRIGIVTPLMHLNKAQTFKLAEEVGILDDVMELSHTCYNGDHSTQHDWGYGCGECPACKIRAAGYREYLAQKPPVVEQPPVAGTPGKTTAEHLRSIGREDEAAAHEAAIEAASKPQAEEGTK